MGSKCSWLINLFNKNRKDEKYENPKLKEFLKSLTIIGNGGAREPRILIKEEFRSYILNK